VADRQIRSALLNEQVYRRLLDGILAGRWPASAKLGETAVAR